MRRYLCLLPLALMLTGCMGSNQELEESLALRSKILGANTVTFEAEISADYGDRVEEFSMECRTDSAGKLRFTVSEPEEISGISGSVAGEAGTLEFDDTVLAFPLMAQERISPVSGPWLMMKALRTGYITACAREGEALRLTVDDSYADDALTLEIWIEGDEVDCCEIAWRGKRALAMEIESFVIG